MLRLQTSKLLENQEPNFIVRIVTFLETFVIVLAVSMKCMAYSRYSGSGNTRGKGNAYAASITTYLGSFLDVGIPDILDSCVY